jgi:secreted PhoX family phosphatase
MQGDEDGPRLPDTQQPNATHATFTECVSGCPSHSPKNALQPLGTGCNCCCSPKGLCIDHAGNVWVATANHTVRRIDAVSGLVSTVAGQAGKVSAKPCTLPCCTCVKRMLR